MTTKAKSKKPTRKVRAAGVGGVVTAGAVSAIFAVAHIGVSKPVAALIASVLTAGLAFAAAYQTRSGS